MRVISLSLFAATVALLMSVSAQAQEAEPSGGIAPLPAFEAPQADPIYTTRDAPKPQPWAKPSPTKPGAGLPASMPFGRASAPLGAMIPSGPHSTVAVPVENVDAVEVSEPAPATPIAPEADPAREDPAQPTELTSPMFDATQDNGGPRKILFRVLNKVTAQSALLEAKPGERLKFGQIDITPVMCRASLPSSQTDYAGLFDIAEHVPGAAEMKPLFRGWMMASSPSIAALEHPVYDVTMVECRILPLVPKTPEKPEKKDSKPSGKKR